LTGFYITLAKVMIYGTGHSERSEESQGQNAVLTPDASLRSA
jgi:hypothetical protein